MSFMKTIDKIRVDCNNCHNYPMRFIENYAGCGRHVWRCPNYENKVRVIE